MQRTGRSGHAQFRVVVQDSRFNPKSGRVVAYVGSYNPHTKSANVDSQKIAKYLENGAQPSDRVARLLQKEGIKLPNWIKLADAKKRNVRNPEKRRSTRSADAEKKSVTDTADTQSGPEEVSSAASENAPTEIADSVSRGMETAAEDPK